MAGWHKPTVPPVLHNWPEEVRALYLRSPEMEAAEFEELFDVALTGKRPDHPGLPAYLSLLPLGLPPILKSGGSVR